MKTEEVIRRPLITEKATLQRELAQQYFFEVDRRATKGQIRDAVEKLFKVRVTQVQTMQVDGKLRRVGRSAGQRPDWKKAMVTLKTGEKIEGLTPTAK